MIPTSDPLERLRAANPVPPATVARTRPDPVLFGAVTSGETAVRRPRRRFRVAVAALSATGVLGGAVAYAVLRDEAPKPQTAGCYEQAAPEARTEVVGVGADGPAAACAELWRRGVLGAGGEVPPLAECVLGTGVVGVFPARPGDDVCARILGPPPAVEPSSTTIAPPTADVNARFLAFRDAVLARVAETPCLEPDAAAALARRELDRAGLAGWTIRAGQFSPERPCATFGFQPEEQAVRLVPSPPRR